MIQLIIDNTEVKIKWISFSDGAFSCKLIDLPKNPKDMSISVSTRTPVFDIREEVDIVMSALNEHYHGTTAHVTLMLPYLPHARADRVFEEGNPHVLAVFMNWLSLYDFDKIYMEDVHNPDFIRHNYPNLPIEMVEQHQLAINYTKREKPDYILAPDKGAFKKAQALASLIDVPLITATKVRDISTGQILSVDLDYTPTKNSRIFIVDDILDGGGTFIPLAKTLKEKYNCHVALYVTHLIAAKGLDILEGIDKLYYTNIIRQYVSREDVINFNQIVK
jgi:ribose-phosphate pyrophosphokinase